MTRKKELTSRGWQRQATYDEPRLSEMAEMYREIGLEVHLEPFHPEDESGLYRLPGGSSGSYKTIYTRKREEAL